MIFKQTFIYIKSCNHCNLKYFGKSCRKTKNLVHKYKGSGIYWNKHLNKHKCNYSTKIIGYFIRKESCKIFCEWYSKTKNIVKSKEWANICNENGLNGGDIFSTLSQEKQDEIREKLRQINLGRKRTEESKEKMRGRIVSEETKEKIRQTLTGFKHSEETKKKQSLMRKGKKAWNKGMTISEETKKKISESLKKNPNLGKYKIGKTHTEKTKNKISNTLKGRVPWNKNRKMLKDYKCYICNINISKSVYTRLHLNPSICLFK